MGNNKNLIRQKKLFPGEIALLLGLLINSFSVALFAKSDMGMSTIALTSYVLNLVFSFFTFGTWSYIIQCSLVLVLVVLLKTIKPGWVLSFILAIIYGYLIDFFNFFILKLPDTLLLHILYYILGFCGLILGTCLLFKCRIPILPFDTFIRDISSQFNISYKKIRISFDISFLIFSALLGFFFIGSFKGIGIGTLINAVFMGISINKLSDLFDKIFYFKPSNHWLGKLSQ